MVKRLLRYLLDLKARRVYYVVTMSDWDSDDPAALAICEAETFGGDGDHGLFKNKSYARAFAGYRSYRADYGTGWLYSVRRATDSEVDGYLNSLEFARE